MPHVSIPDGMYDFERSLRRYGVSALVGKVDGACCAIWPDNVVPDTLWLQNIYMAKIPIVHSALTQVPDKYISYDAGVGTKDVASLSRVLDKLIGMFDSGDYSQCKRPKAPPMEQVVDTRIQQASDIPAGDVREFEPLPLNIDDNEYLSICMSLKNRSFYIEGLIANLECQDYDLKKIELCIADGGSTDNLKEVLQKHASKFAHVKYVTLGRSQLPFEVKGNHIAPDLNSLVAQTASFEKVIHIDPEVRLGNIGSLRRIASALDRKDMIVYLPCQKLSEGVEWREEPQYGTHEVHGSPIKNDGMYCVGFNRSYYIKTGGMDERFCDGNDGEAAYFHFWHQDNSTWNCVRDDFQCYHLYHQPTSAHKKPHTHGMVTMYQRLKNEASPLNGGQTDWSEREILSELNIWRDGDKPAISVVIPYMHSTQRHKLLKMVTAEIRKYQTVRNIEIIVSEVGVSNKANKIKMPDKKLYNRTIKWIKGEAVTYGVLEAESELVLMLDCDIIPRGDFVEALCVEYAKGNHSMQLGGDLFKTSKKTFEIMQGYSKSIIKGSWWDTFVTAGIPEHIGDTVANEYGRIFTVYPGGAVAFTKRLYINVGGISERYVGHGYEDKLFQDILDFASPKHLRRPDIPIIHLFHDQSAAGSKNKEYYEEDRQATLPVVIKNNRSLFKKKYGAKL